MSLTETNQYKELYPAIHLPLPGVSTDSQLKNSVRKNPISDAKHKCWDPGLSDSMTVVLPWQSLVLKLAGTRRRRQRYFTLTGKLLRRGVAQTCASVGALL